MWWWRLVDRSDWTLDCVNGLRGDPSLHGPGGSGRIPSLRPGRARLVPVGSPPTTQARRVAILRGASSIRGSCGRRRGLRWRRSSAGSSRSGGNARRRFRTRAGVIRPNAGGGGVARFGGRSCGLTSGAAPARSRGGVVRFERLRSRPRWLHRRASSGYPRRPALAEGSIEATGAVTRPHLGTAKAAASAGTIRSRRLAHGARMPW